MDKQLQTSQRIFTKAQIDERVKYLLCVDMDSHQIFTINLKSHEIFIEYNVPSAYRSKAEKDIKDIQRLVQLPDSSWNMDTQRNQRYRRREISEYLLHKIVNQEPTYLAESSMSDAFSEVTSLKLIVDLSDYLRIEDQSYNDINPVTIELDVDLVTCSDEVIKKILRAVYNNFQVRLKTKSLENQFVLQISGFREYLAGNYSILSYDRVRMSLRGIQYLQVNLTEVPRVRRMYDNFPPIFERNGDESVPWDQFIDIPCFLFYAPYPLPPYVNVQQSFQFLDQIGQTKGKQNEKINKNGSRFCPLQPRLFLKEKCLEFIDMRYKMLEEPYFHLKKSIIYSGECDYRFKIQILCLSNVHRLFILDDKDLEEFKKENGHKRRATYNGLCPPRFITKSSAKQEELHNTSKKKAKVEDEEKLQKKISFLKLSKTKDQDTWQLKQLQKGIFNPHFFNHGPQGTANMEYLMQKYELDIQPYLISIQVMLMYGQTPLTKFSIMNSQKVAFRKNIWFQQDISFQGLKISQLPMELRLCFNVILHSSNGEEQIIGSTISELFDENGRMKQGRINLNIWPFYKCDTRIACMNEYYGAALPNEQGIPYYTQLVIGMPKFIEDVYWSLRDEKYMKQVGFPSTPLNLQQICLQYNNGVLERRGTLNTGITVRPQRDWKATPNTNELAKLDTLLKFDPLQRHLYTDDDKFILLKCRNYYKNQPSAFPIFLCAINWSDPEEIREVYQMMNVWTSLPSDDALPLLDANFSDELVRYYATKRVGLYKDDELVLFMLELTQALIFEQCHFSPLGEMLIERSIMNPWVVGHELFWQLRSQLHIQPTYERYSLILEQLMMLFGNYRYELFGEVQVNDEIMKIAEQIKNEKDSNKRLYDMKLKLQNVRQQFSKTFQFAIDPRMSASEMIYDKCKILDSKKLPLWLVMKSAETRDVTQIPKKVIMISSKTLKDTDCLENLRKQKENRKTTINEKFLIIFKCGDDIRQDLLTLQLIKIMDKIWLDFGLDFRMKPYKVISTFDQVGMIEVVLNSDTTSSIHENAGKFGALNKSSIMEYLKKHNKHSMVNAVENFLRSCAGYCVATYLLGIGDRHSGNIMLTESGHLFHIDFGHFLGNFKTKYGINRERTPFVFTQEMAYVMGGVQGQNFKRFEDFCTKAYNQIRQHGHLLINIFLMNLSAGMPELQEIADIEYLREKLQLGIGEQQATELFRKEITTSLNDMWRKIDNLIHNFKRT
ncbi:unnamed protein product [Paramecium sonneborni]|uniref:Phosphatidylinositol 3-kinase n=1 Tax=Paramecium sonneborni TaxID=65129 RepID=A0A8S1QZT9_9CILI|nr:unnamed protein product [Paramecium sonneborni]